MPVAELQDTMAKCAPACGYGGLHKAQFLSETTRRLRLHPLVLGPLKAVNLALLAWAAFPWERIVAVGVLWGVDLVTLAWLLRRMKGKPLTEQGLFVFAMCVIGVQAGVLALTGGLSSPFSPLILLVGMMNVVSFGGTLHGRIAALTLAAVVAGLAFVPDEPSIAYPFNIAITALTVLTALLLFAQWLVALLRSYHEAGEKVERIRGDLLEQATARARELEALSSKVAHELKNPLAAVKGLTQLLHRSQCDERSRERIGVIAEEITRMEGILGDYLSFSRPLEELRAEPLGLGELADEVLAVLEARAIAAGVRLGRGGEGAAIVGDSRRLKEALLNLVSNAIEATPPDGSVEVVVERGHECAGIVIRDSGRGIPPDALARVGTPFFTTRPGGTGLGVVLARSAIHQHGGDLSYASEVGRGTTVTVTLPARPPRPSSVAIPPREAASAHG